MNFPSSKEKLQELIGKTEVVTTDGQVADMITAEDIGYIYQWLLWIADSFESPIPTTERPRRAEKA